MVINKMVIEQKQKELCARFKVKYQICDLNLKVGISKNFCKGEQPIHGLRVKAEGDTSGWYIWCGEWSDAPDFFKPLHGIHLQQWAEIVMPYLGLPEGWRFLLAENYEDVWEDPALLND